MSKHARLCVAVVMATLTASFAVARADDDWTKPDADPDGSIALAQQLEAIAHQELRNSPSRDQAWGTSAALFRAAAKLDPKESRYLRSLIDDLLDGGDAAGAMDALTAYRKLEPDDCGAQIRQIDLYLAKMENVDKKVEYLRRLMERQQIPMEVRSAIAVRRAQLLVQRADIKEAIKVLNTALVLEPINIDAARLKYQLTAPTAFPMDRTMLLLAMLRANPSDPAVASQLAQELANIGLVQLSVLWYNYANNLYQRSTVLPDPAFGRGAASELLIDERTDDAAALIGQFLTVLPNDTDGWFISLAIARDVSNQNKDDKKLQAAYDTARQRTAIALTNAVQEMRASSGDSTATTRPIDADGPSALPDLSGDPQLLRKSGSLDLANAYISAVSSLAWFDLYYRQDAQAADPLLKVLGILLDKDVQLERLRGWRKYVAGDFPGAVAIWTPIADQDPYAALGLVMVDLQTPGKHQKALARAQTLMESHPSGVIGATLWSELRGVGVKPSAPNSPQADAIATVVENMPRLFMQMVDQPISYYLVSADPVSDSYEFGQPVLIRLSVRNIGAVPIAIGPNCALRADFWFDAYFRGALDQGVTGAAIERMDKRFVLLPGQVMETVVRVDQDALYPIFTSAPSLDLTMNMMIASNPVQIQQNGENRSAKSGPCGYRSQLTRLVERVPLPVSTADERTKFADRLAQGDGGVTLRTLAAMAAYVAPLRSKSTPENDAVAQDFVQKIQKSQQSDVPAVHAFSRAMFFAISADDARNAAVTEMIQDSDWRTRLLGEVAASTTKRTDVFVTLATDSDPIVRDYARAAAKAAGLTVPPLPTPPPPAPAAQTSTQPSTAPATQPTTAPANP